MKTNYTIFVSGSKSLKEHRLRLKALVSNMNGEHRLEGSPISLNMFSYVNLGDNQAEYNDFIQKKSDIVLFILEKSIGAKTLEEFRLASQAHKEQGKPKILVFLQDYKEKTEEIARIEQMVSADTNASIVNYSDLDDLEEKVREQLTAVISKESAPSEADAKKTSHVYKIWAWVSTFALLLFLGYGVKQCYSVSNGVTLLFIGGGSAVNCLEELHPDVGDLYDYPGSFCLAVPTSTSWPIISSEIIRHSETKVAHAYPISLSAMAASESDFLSMSNKSQFVTKGAVLSYYLGEDYLMAYVKKTVRHSLIDGKESITAEDLSQLLRDIAQQDFMVFTTEVGSGTLTSYQRILAPYDITISKSVLGEQVDKFTDLTPKSKIIRDETPYIMLGSKYYVAKEVYKEGDCRGLKVLDMDGNPISKSIVLYFSGFTTDDGTAFWIPDEMVRFLKKIDGRFEHVFDGNRIPRKNEMVVVSLNDYLNEISPATGQEK
ncbi:MAG: hypothetical protein K5683_02585 [Prevotella sp.]|nr:hypothetical protein [Prevotella sp.]